MKKQIIIVEECPMRLMTLKYLLEIHFRLEVSIVSVPCHPTRLACTRHTKAFDRLDSIEVFAEFMKKGSFNRRNAEVSIFAVALADELPTQVDNVYCAAA